jgi:hypothetical protein
MLFCVFLAGRAAAHEAGPVAPPEGTHVGLGVGVGASLGGTVVSTDLGGYATSSANLWISGSIRVRGGRGFTWEPEVECAASGAVANDADEEPTARERLGQCRAGVSVRPRIAARGALELHAIVGLAYAGEWVDALAASDGAVTGREVEHGLVADGGVGLQKWLARDFALSVDLRALAGAVRFDATEDASGELIGSDASWSLAVDPGARMMLHLYW